MTKKHYLCCMKLSLKYIALPVIATLIAIFAYQVYWLAGLYTTMQAKMQSDIREALRMADYGEMLHRVFGRLQSAWRDGHGHQSDRCQGRQRKQGQEQAATNIETERRGDHRL